MSAGRRGPGRGTTSDLSIDEVLLLHSIGWEPVDLVCGASVTSIPQGAWRWSTGEVTAASAAYGRAVSAAVDRMGGECNQVSGHGVVGVKPSFAVRPHAVEAVLVGTAVRPTGASSRHPRAFVSDLSSRDFALLNQAGWEPLGLAFGAAFVYAPRRSVGASISQKGQNVELTNLTEALYAARESAMEQMQSSALGLGARGVVAVNIAEGPMYFASHVMGFTAWGTAVTPGPSGHAYRRPEVVVSLDDRVAAFEATSLRGGA